MRLYSYFILFSYASQLVWLAQPHSLKSHPYRLVASGLQGRREKGTEQTRPAGSLVDKDSKADKVASGSRGGQAMFPKISGHYRKPKGPCHQPTHPLPNEAQICNWQRGGNIAHYADTCGYYGRNQGPVKRWASCTYSHKDGHRESKCYSSATDTQRKELGSASAIDAAVSKPLGARLRRLRELKIRAFGS